MSDRVLSTGTAREAITRLQTIINGPLLEQINDLTREGQKLADPNVWDGRLATEYRGRWQETQQQLKTVKDSLDELRRQMAQINQNIMQAGGNQ